MERTPWIPVFFAGVTFEGGVARQNPRPLFQEACADLYAFTDCLSSLPLFAILRTAGTAEADLTEAQHPNYNFP